MSHGGHGGHSPFLWGRYWTSRHTGGTILLLRSRTCLHRPAESASVKCPRVHKGRRAPKIKPLIGRRIGQTGGLIRDGITSASQQIRGGEACDGDACRPSVRSTVTEGLREGRVQHAALTHILTRWTRYVAARATSVVSRHYMVHSSTYSSEYSSRYLFTPGLFHGESESPLRFFNSSSSSSAMYSPRAISSNLS